MNNRRWRAAVRMGGLCVPLMAALPPLLSLSRPELPGPFSGPSVLARQGLDETTSWAAISINPHGNLGSKMQMFCGEEHTGRVRKNSVSRCLFSPSYVTFQKKISKKRIYFHAGDTAGTDPALRTDLRLTATGASVQLPAGRLFVCMVFFFWEDVPCSCCGCSMTPVSLPTTAVKWSATKRPAVKGKMDGASPPPPPLSVPQGDQPAPIEHPLPTHPFVPFSVPTWRHFWCALQELTNTTNSMGFSEGINELSMDRSKEDEKPVDSEPVVQDLLAKMKVWPLRRRLALRCIAHRPS